MVKNKNIKILFITTFGQTIPREHIFTRNLWYELKSSFDAYVLTFKVGDNVEAIEYNAIQKSYILWIPQSTYDSRLQTIKYVSKYFKQIAPDIIHSNMVEGFEIEAAHMEKIPIVLTMHIGGLICPRGGGNGLLKWDNSICDGVISMNCKKCILADFPLPILARSMDSVLSIKIKNSINNFINNRKIFYLTPLLNIDNVIKNRLQVIESLKKATTVIAANIKLAKLLSKYEIRTEIIKHGIKNYSRPDYPIIKRDSIVKFFFLGRIQYSKGLHILLNALSGISTNLYELHVFGAASSQWKEQRYMCKILRLSKGKNVIFHNSIENDKLPVYLKEMHVMIHPTIYHEVYGINVSEALCLGKPVLATKCGGPEMQIMDGVNGWLVAPNSEIELHDKILEIIKNKLSLPQYSLKAHTPNTLTCYMKELYELYSKKVKK